MAHLALSLAQQAMSWLNNPVVVTRLVILSLYSCWVGIMFQSHVQSFVSTSSLSEVVDKYGTTLSIASVFYFALMALFCRSSDYCSGRLADRRFCC
jgi:hypothetical protein